MIYTYEHVLKLTGEATQQINELLEIDGPLKRSIGRYRKGEKVFLKVSMADNQDVELSLDDGTLEIESAHHDARSLSVRRIWKKTLTSTIGGTTLRRRL